MRLEVYHSGSSAGKKMNSNQATRRLVPFLFFLMQNGAVLDKKLGIFLPIFNFSPPTFDFFQSYSLIDPKLLI